jgi:NAD(P)-dependent dehydrogenase (short-subunit alcohol dehydrogenase family)
MDITGRGALVVGGASGLGAATARALAGRGARVTIAGLNAGLGEALAAELGASFIVCDVRQEEQVAAAVAQAAAVEGGLWISVCCAGIGRAQRLASRRQVHPLEPFHRVIEVNLVGTFNVLRLAAQTMMAHPPDAGGERGVCINTASLAAFEGQVGQIAYAASKAGVVGMTLPAARDLAPSGVRVIAIAPGPFDTPLLSALPDDARESLEAGIPFPARLGHPREFAALTVHAIENPMLNGETIRLDGALRMPPR